MKQNINKLNTLVKLVDLNFRRKHIVVLNPEEKKEGEELGEDILYDTANWNLPKKLKVFVKELSQNNQLSPEDKILSIYEKICTDYVYDDNLISYIQKLNDNSFFVPDEYGRTVGEEWEKNRERHNRRICYEVSRYLAKSLSILFADREDIDVCILWDKGITHYFVGLSTKDYSVTLDLDDFNNIKDLTRLKTGLTAKGIRFLDDRYGVFKSAVDKFNQGREKFAIINIENEIENYEDKKDYNDMNKDESEDILFLKNAIQVLVEEYQIDSQGLFEYMKEIVDIKLGPKIRKKVWKVLKGDGERDKRHIRCLVLYIDDKKYIIDVDKKILRPFSADEFDKAFPEFIKYEDGTRDWGEPYNGK